MTNARQYFKTAGRGAIAKCASDTGYSFDVLRLVIARQKKCSVRMAKKICVWAENSLSVADFLTGLDDANDMPHAKKHFKTLGYGAIKQCAKETGFTHGHLTDVINLRRKCSLFTAQCISTWTKGALTTNDFLIGKGK